MLTKETVQFFRELRENNHKDWFDLNRKRYDAVRADYLSLTTTILEKMKRQDPSFDFLTPKECQFRINRDVRFSKNKAPYKTNLAMIFAPNGKKMHGGSYYLHLEEGQSMVGGGMYMPEAPLLKKVRTEIHYFYDDFTKIINKSGFKKTYGGVDIDDKILLKRAPKGFEETDPAIEYLKLKSYTAIKKFDDAMITSPELVPFVVETLSHLKDFVSFINRAIASNEDGGI